MQARLFRRRAVQRHADGWATATAVALPQAADCGPAADLTVSPAAGLPPCVGCGTAALAASACGGGALVVKVMQDARCSCRKVRDSSCSRWCRGRGTASTRCRRCRLPRRYSQAPHVADVLPKIAHEYV